MTFKVSAGGVEGHFRREEHWRADFVREPGDRELVSVGAGMLNPGIWRFSQGSDRGYCGASC